MRNPVVAWLVGIASQLRFPWLLALTVGLLLLDLVIPDLVPFVDEILLSLTALVLAAFRKPRDARAQKPFVGDTGTGQVIDVEPARDAKDDTGKP